MLTAGFGDVAESLDHLVLLRISKIHLNAHSLGTAFHCAPYQGVRIPRQHLPIRMFTTVHSRSRQVHHPASGPFPGYLDVVDDAAVNDDRICHDAI